MKFGENWLFEEVTIYAEGVNMREYQVTYTEHDAIYPAEKLHSTISAEKEKIWELGIALGTVYRIYDMDALTTVFSSSWDFNFLGLTKSDISKNWE